MANANDIFIICFVLSCVGNVISDIPDIKKNPEETMRPSSFETIEKRIAEMVDIQVADMVETRVYGMLENRVVKTIERRVAEVFETRFAEVVEARLVEMVDKRVVQEMSELKNELKRELAFDMTEEYKKMNEKNKNYENKHEYFDNIANADLRQHLKDELLTELNQSISSAVPRAVRDLPYLVTCAYQVNVAQVT